MQSINTSKLSGRRITMTEASGSRRTAMELLERMFEVEMRFVKSDADDLDLLTSAFHRDVVIHEPKSLPYSGDWTGLAGVGALFRRMREVWSDLSVEGLEAARTGDTVFMACALSLTSRATGATIKQPFAEMLHFSGDLLIDGTPFYYDTAEILAALQGNAKSC
jgi:ketosteroid isomerase-like protein